MAPSVPAVLPLSTGRLPALLRRLGLSTWLALSLVLAGLFRVPPLVNAAAINSDAAIVGLQTRHFLNGDWALQLWGTAYQTATESFLLMPLFAIGGSRPIFVFFIPLLGMLAMIVLVHRLLRSHLPEAAAFACTLPLVFATQAINSPMTFIMRQVMATWVTLGVFLLSRASSGRLHRYFAGGFVFAAGILIDTFALELLPAGLLLAILCASDGLIGEDGIRASLRRERKLFGQRLRRATGGMAGALALAFAIGQLALFRPRPPAAAAARAAAIAAAPLADRVVDHLAANGKLFVECASFALGARTWIPGPTIPTPEWAMPTVLRVVFGVGALVLVGLIVSAVPLGLSRAARRRKIPWEIRRLGLFGFACGLTAVLAFLITGAPKDIWSTRYLAPLLWFAPLAIAPAITSQPPRRALALVGAWAVGAATCGWIAYGSFVDGPRVRLDPRGAAVAEREVMTRLRERDIHGAYAQYWLAYRLSLLFEENPLVVPIDPKDDRRAALRAQVDKESRVALIFHPSTPRSDPDPDRTTARASGALEEEIRVEDFTVLIVKK